MDGEKKDSTVVAKVEEKPVMAPGVEPTRWQVKFKSGQGQQVVAGSADDARVAMAKLYGEDYAIESITELK